MCRVAAKHMGTLKLHSVMLTHEVALGQSPWALVSNGPPWMASSLPNTGPPRMALTTMGLPRTALTATAPPWIISAPTAPRWGASVTAGSRGLTSYGVPAKNLVGGMEDSIHPGAAANNPPLSPALQHVPFELQHSIPGVPLNPSSTLEPGMDSGQFGNIWLTRPGPSHDMESNSDGVVEIHLTTQQCQNTEGHSGRLPTTPMTSLT